MSRNHKTCSYTSVCAGWKLSEQFVLECSLEERLEVSERGARGEHGGRSKILRRAEGKWERVYGRMDGERLEMVVEGKYPQSLCWTLFSSLNI